MINAFPCRVGKIKTLGADTTQLENRPPVQLTKHQSKAAISTLIVYWSTKQKLPPVNLMTEIIDISYFTELKETAPETLCRQGRCNYSADLNQYSLTIWGDQYHIDLNNSKIEHVVVHGPPPHQYFDLFTIYYLLRAKDILLSGEWVSEKDLPGGPTFFRGPHLIPTDQISNRFANDLKEFKTVCESLGGTPIEMADAAFSFSITPDIPVAVLYWTGDEDFPAEAKLLYDRSISELLSLDILFALAVGVCTRIGTVA